MDFTRRINTEYEERILYFLGLAPKDEKEERPEEKKKTLRNLAVQTETEEE